MHLDSGLPRGTRLPAQDWSLEGLARATGLSRSALVTRFADLLGTSPMRYLRDWRLFLAERDLAGTQVPIITVATRAGYGTEAAFTRAFRRCYGTPPAEWRRARAA